MAEGGGCCGLANFRTLCTPCHRAETQALRQRLQARKRKQAAGATPDIRQMMLHAHAEAAGAAEQPRAELCAGAAVAPAEGKRARAPLLASQRVQDPEVVDLASDD